MKKFLSILLCVFVLMSAMVIAVCAEDAAQTVVSVKEGDEVVYSLNLDTPDKVVGCDFSIYYDSSKLTVSEVADFTGNYDADSHQALINPNLSGEVRGNWSILSGVKFDGKSVCSVKFTATEDTDVHLSYYVRYMYPESLKQCTDYTFTCNVDVNSKNVIDNAAPELNVDQPQSDGLFVNSVTGKGSEASVNTADNPQTEPTEGKTKNTDANTAETTNNSMDNDKNKIDGVDVADKENSDKKSDYKGDNAFVSFISELITSIWFWVIIGCIVIAIVLFVIYYFKVLRPSHKEGLDD